MLVLCSYLVSNSKLQDQMSIEANLLSFSFFNFLAQMESLSLSFFFLFSLQAYFRESVGNRVFLIFFIEILLAVKLATQPFSNSILAFAISGVLLITETPDAETILTLDLTILKRMSISWIIKSCMTSTSVALPLNGATLLKCARQLASLKNRGKFLKCKI